MVQTQKHPSFNAWLETSRMPSKCLASEAVVRTWSIQFPWLDRPDFYRSGLSTRTLASHFAGTIRKRFVHLQTTCWRVSEIRAMFHAEARESPGAPHRKEARKKHE
jgi:hypothetical protein